MQKNFEKKYFASLQDNISVIYYNKLLDNDLATKYFNILEKYLIYNTDEDSKVKIFGKEQYIPRKQVAYGEDGTYYQFAGTKVNAKSWNEPKDIVCSTLRKIKRNVELFTGNKYNFVLINRYANGDDYIGFHADDERSLDENAGVVGISLGAEREFQFIPKNNLLYDLSIKKISLILHHGSIVYMNYPTNNYWKHSLPKSSKIKKPRISLTFRNLKN